MEAGSSRAHFCGEWELVRCEGQSEFLEAMELNFVMRKLAKDVTPTRTCLFLDAEGVLCSATPLLGATVRERYKHDTSHFEERMGVSAHVAYR